MFYLWREVYDPKHPRFCVVKFQENIGIQQYEKYESLIDTLQETLQYPYYDHHFLLDDGRFHFFRFNIFRETNTPLTKEDINLIINDRLEYLKTISDETFLFTSIDSIFVNNQPKKFLIGEKGQIFFRLYFVYMNRNTVLSFNKVYGNLFNQENLHIRPESFQTVAFLKKKLERDSFLLLYIKENYCKVILVEDGFYKQIEHINF